MQSIFKLGAAVTVTGVLVVTSLWFSVGPKSSAYVAANQADYFLRIDGIEGEIPLESFSWGMGTTTTGRRQYQPLVIRKKIDKLSSTLYRVANEGRHISKMTFYKNTEAGSADYSVVFEDVQILSFTHEGSQDETPTEDLALSFSRASY